MFSTEREFEISESKKLNYPKVLTEIRGKTVKKEEKSSVPPTGSPAAGWRSKNEVH